ncbi:MAG: gephyrin-like molybdotransferase Glp [Gemmataceae bacterium]
MNFPDNSHQAKGVAKNIGMRGFQDRAEVANVLTLLNSRVGRLPSETVAISEASQRVLADDVIADVSVPNFDRAAMDGYALIGSETFGAGPYNPLDFAITGSAFPGRPFLGKVASGQAVRIMTGAPLPDGADAVLQAEAAEEVNGLLRVIEPVPPGRHVGRRGEDILPGTIVLQLGRVLRPQDLGVLASIGVAQISVVRRPGIDILVTGDELLPCGSRPQGYRIVDSNSVMLAALIERDGGLTQRIALIPDKRAAVESAMKDSEADVLLISGGSSVGQEDHAPRVLAEIGELSIHGVALRPASPAGIGFLGNRPVFLLPGNPVSCLCAYDLFAGTAIRRLAGRSMELPYRSRQVKLGRKISSAIGRVDYVRVAIRDDEAEPLAISGASILTSTTRAAGFVLVPGDSEGYGVGEQVQVYLYDF